MITREHKAHVRHLVRAGGKVRVRVRGRVRRRRRAGVGQPAACMSRSSSDQPKAVICCTVELPSSPAASALKSPGAIWILCSRSHSPYGALAALGLGLGSGLGLANPDPNQPFAVARLSRVSRLDLNVLADLAGLEVHRDLQAGAEAALPQHVLVLVRGCGLAVRVRVRG